jgi:hypothetical protein
MGFGAKVKGFLGSPTPTFSRVKQDTLGDAVKYILIWTPIYGVLLGLIFLATLDIIAGIYGMSGVLLPLLTWLHGMGFLIVPIIVGYMVVGGIVGLFIGSAWTHLWVYLLGGREGFTQTFKAVAYGATPSYAFGWIPFVGGIVGSIWAIVLTIIGIRELHGITTGRAVGAYLLAVFIPGVIITFIIIFIIIMRVAPLSG